MSLWIDEEYVLSGGFPKFDPEMLLDINAGKLSFYNGPKLPAADHRPDNPSDTEEGENPWINADYQIRSDKCQADVDQECQAPAGVVRPVADWLLRELEPMRRRLEVGLPITPAEARYLFLHATGISIEPRIRCQTCNANGQVSQRLYVGETMIQESMVACPACYGRGYQS